MFTQAGDLNLDYYLGKNERETLEDIEAGRVDSFLDVLLMFEPQRQNRDAVKAAVKARKYEINGDPSGSVAPLAPVLRGKVIV